MATAASGDALISIHLRALALWRQPITWRRIQSRAMSRDFSWTQSANQYRDLYYALANVTVGASVGEPPALKDAAAAAAIALPAARAARHSAP